MRAVTINCESTWPGLIVTVNCNLNSYTSDNLNTELHLEATKITVYNFEKDLQL